MKNMEATELMIGDLVVHIPTKKNVRIIGINPDGTIGVTAPLDDGSKFWWVFIDSLNPIPLTPEILEKNGWKEMPSGTICYWDKTNKSNDIICDSGLPFSFLGRTFCPKYVHELQHALRLCGLNELADNFKV